MSQNLALCQIAAFRLQFDKEEGFMKKKIYGYISQNLARCQVFQNRS